MELADIRRNALAARQFSVEIAPAVFTLTVPTHMQSSLAYAQAMRGAGFDGAAQIRFQRALLLASISGWSGVLVRHAWREHTGADALDYESDAVELLLDAQSAWEATLVSALLDKIAERKAQEDTAAKN